MMNMMMMLKRVIDITKAAAAAVAAVVYLHDNSSIISCPGRLTPPASRACPVN